MAICPRSRPRAPVTRHAGICLTRLSTILFGKKVNNKLRKKRLPQIHADLFFNRSPATFATISADLLKAQIDTFFIEQVGKSPAEYIRKYAGRLPLLHLKDKANELGAVQAEVGHGTIDWTAVLAAANEAGVEWLIVEQNCADRPAFKSVEMSFDFLKSAAV